VIATQVTPSFFKVLGTPPVLGRALLPSEQGVKAPAVVVLSYGFWRSRLGSDPEAVGKTITLDGLPHTIVGIMPQGFDYPKGAQLWRPLNMDDASQRPIVETRPMRMVAILAKLKAGVDSKQLDTEIARLREAIYRQYPRAFVTSGFLNGMTLEATPLERRMTGDVRPALLVLSGAVVLVLLIASANLASLLLARAIARRRELAVRLALGSARGRIIRQVLTESLVLALPGGLAGTLIALVSVAALNASKPSVLRNYPPITLDTVKLAFSAGLTLITGLLFGLAPAWSAAGVGVLDALKTSGYSQTSARGAIRLRRALVIAELGVSLVLLIGVGLLGRSFVKLASVPLGFSPDNLLTLRFNLTGSRYAKVDTQLQFYDDVLERVRRLPGVTHAAVATDLPLVGEHAWSASRLQLARQPMIGVGFVSRDFFRTLGIPLKAGRTFSDEDSPAAPDKVVINEAFAKQVFPDEGPIGKRVLMGGIPTGWTIVGVVGSIRSNSLGAEPTPLVYHCNCQGGGNRALTRMALFVRTSGDPTPMVRLIEDQIHRVDRNEPLTDVSTMNDRLTAALATPRFHLLLIGAFAAIALLLAAIGVFGVVSYLVTHRTREIGIRMALGARIEDVLRLVLGESLGWVIAAIVLGLGGAWGLTRYLKSMLYGVTPVDSMTFVLMPLMLAVAGLAASLAPAAKATRVSIRPRHCAKNRRSHPTFR
jgi:putative ABC transport system permease protein